MNFKLTPEQSKAILATLRALYANPFRCESDDAKRNAQRNLCGRTHYVDDDTLRWHKSRVLSAHDAADGLMFWICESTALDMQGTTRGFRFVVFDVFGTCVSCPSLENCASTRRAAREMVKDLEIDVAAHYREVFAEMAKRKRDEVAALESFNG